MYKDAPLSDRYAIASEATCCRSCGGTDLTWTTTNMKLMTPSGYPLSGDMAVITCKDCGFIGNASPSVNADYIDYYTRFNKHYTRVGALGLIDKAYFEGVLDLIGNDGGLDWQKTDVLDFGSGALAFSELARERGARAAYNYDMESPYPDLAYGLVVSTHCFEHVYNFNTEFARIREILADDGLFCVAVPDMRGYDELYYGPYNCFDLEHINHFEITTLTDALARAGFTIVSTRESERRVTPTLAYPEILVLARKAAEPQPEPKLPSIRSAPAEVMAHYLSRSARDLEVTVGAVHATVADYAEKGIAARFGVYGLSSYAFRLLQTLADRAFDGFDWMADSDARLTGRSIAGKTILGADDFAALVAESKAAGMRSVAFVSAVNGHRIETYLAETYGGDVDVVMLPPDCQNRTPTAEFSADRARMAERNWVDPEVRATVRAWHDGSRTFDYQYMFQWLGLPIIQDPQDIAALSEIIWRVQPDVIVETGIARGGSLVLSASILAAIAHGEMLRTGAYTPRKVIGIDIDIRAHNRKAIESHPLAPMITLIQGSSIDAAIIDAVKAAIGEAKTVLVFLDSNHTRDHVFEELKLYAPMVTSGSAVVVLDTGIEYAPQDTFNVTRPWGPGNSPLTAVNDFLATEQGADFVKDRSIEKRHLLTCAPEGLLVRL
ncbi:CmcI family methyltransferase [Ensifer soli]|uniref:CmcI family methyltransferase n=1 Tax=Ciceribacter sp. sgz301302 TaxID=3342379 RepID=UPI0035B8F24E